MPRRRAIGKKACDAGVLARWAGPGSARSMGQGRVSGAVSGRVLGGFGWPWVAVLGRSFMLYQATANNVKVLNSTAFPHLCHSKRQQTNALIDRMADGDGSSRDVHPRNFARGKRCVGSTDTRRNARLDRR